MKDRKTQPGPLIPEFLGKDEMNLAEYPFSLLTHRTPAHLKTYTFTQEIIDGKGKTISQTWSILGSDKFGLPTPYDDDVILALLYCYKDQNFQGPRSGDRPLSATQDNYRTRAQRVKPDNQLFIN